MVTLDDFRTRMSSAGLKATPQRLIIYDILFHSKNHPTPEMVYEIVKQKNPGISLGTVYKNLETFVASGLAEKVKTQDNVLRFDARTDNHSHIYLTDTNEILDFEDPELHRLLDGYFAQKGIPNLAIKDIRIQVMGEKINKNAPVAQPSDV